MINTAKVQSFIRTINQFDIAVSNFQLRYKADLPGDSSAFGCTNGDVGSAQICNDGLIGV